jgi:hypothetical protein
MDLLLCPLLAVSRIYRYVFSNVLDRVIRSTNDQSVTVPATLFGIDAARSLEPLDTIHDKPVSHNQLSGTSQYRTYAEPYISYGSGAVKILMSRAL